MTALGHRSWFWTLAAVLGAGLAPLAARGVEPAEEFLQGLRDRGYHDMALEYLQRMEASPLAPVKFKVVVQYERGVTLIEASKRQRDGTIRERQLDEAQAALTAFIEQEAAHELANAARSQMGNLLVERARMRREKAEKNAAQKEALLTEARGMYAEALQTFTSVMATLKTELESLPKVLTAGRDDRLIARRDQFRSDYLQAQLLKAALLEEMAETAAKPEERTKFLTDAIAEYKEIYEKHRTRAAGLYALLYQARSHQKLGQHKEALGLFAELLELPDQPDAFRTLKLKTLDLASTSWLDPSIKQHRDAVAQLTPFLDQASPAQLRADEWAALQLRLAQAHAALAAELSAANASDPEAKKSLSEAKKLALAVSRFPGAHQEAAKQLLLQVGGPDLTQTGPPQTFDDARIAGKDALDAVQAAAQQTRDLPAQIAAEQDAAKKAELEQQLAAAQKTLADGPQQALQMFRLALEKADENTATPDVNVVQYFLCYLYYTLQRYPEAAVMGEFVARRYPDSAGARQCAKIALASYIKLHAEQQAADKSFEVRRLMSLAEYMAAQWGAHPEGAEAVGTLITFSVQAGDLAKAEQYLQQIPAESPKRAEAELRTGQALWASYLMGMQALRNSQQPGGAPPADPAAEEARLLDVRTRAERIMTDGVARIGQGGVIDAVAAGAALSLAQLYLDTERPAEAVALLEHPQYGPLTLVSQKHPAADQKFTDNAYKTALRAYVSSMQDPARKDDAIAKAKGLMDAMKAAAGADEAKQAQLLQVYLGLAQDLKKQMEIASPEAKAGLAGGFEVFLQQVGRDAKELNVLTWVAETFFAMAESYDTNPAALTPQANKYYTAASAGYDRILAQPGLGDKPAVQTKLRKAIAQRKLGEFEASIQLLAEILKVKGNNSMINVQVEAARTYQEWAVKSNDSSHYLKAMVGGEPGADNKNSIWGWGRLAQTVARYPNLRDTFHEARYNTALCRFNLGKAKQDNKLLKLAKQDIALTYRLYPDLGGETWTKEYDKLLRSVQQRLGEPQIGLEEFKKPAAAPAAAAPAAAARS